MKRLTVLVVSLVAFSSPIAVAQHDGFLGTWVLDVAKSKYTPGPPPTKQVSVYERAGSAVKVTTNATYADGRTTTTSFTSSFDGKDAPVTGSPDYDSVALTRVDDHTVKLVRKLAGKVVQTGTMVLSNGGKTRTVDVTGVNAKGQKIHTIGVYDKKSSTTT